MKFLNVNENNSIYSDVGRSVKYSFFFIHDISVLFSLEDSAFTHDLLYTVTEALYKCKISILMQHGISLWGLLSIARCGGSN